MDQLLSVYSIRSAKSPVCASMQSSNRSAAMLLQGAEQMGQMEHLLNVYATRSAKGAIADFVGYTEVRESEATMRLTQGLWLVRNSSQSETSPLVSWSS